MMSPIKSRPPRALKPERWPTQHRSALESALSNHAQAHLWSKETIRSVEQRWGLWLDSCRRSGFPVDGHPSSTVTQASLKAWVHELRNRVAGCTAASYVRDAREALRVMEPKASDALMLMLWAASDLQRVAQALPDERTAQVAASQIYEAAIGMLDDVFDTCINDINAASEYRDGLLVAFDVLTGVRRRTLTLTHERHLCLLGNAYELYYEPSETKTREAFEATMPEAFTRYIARGFDVARFMSSNAGTSWDGHLWISGDGIALTDRQVYHKVCEMTERLLSVRLNPQRLRRVIPTSIQRFMPTKRALATASLQHSSQQVTQSNYNKAGPSSSIREYHRLLAELSPQRPKL